MATEAEGFHPMRGTCAAWIGKLNKAIKHKQPWSQVAEECEHFFSASTGFLWDPKYKFKFWDTDTGPVKPKFKLTIARAFELVALFGPTLYWRNPIRTAEVRDLPEIPPEVFRELVPPIPPQVMQQLQMQQQMQQQQQAMQAQQQGQPPPEQQPPPDPVAMMAEQMFQRAQQEYQQELPARKLRAELMQRYLNWTPNVLNLHTHAEQAITQGLVTGRGCLWTMPYQPPGSNRIVVGSFFDPVENLLIDPDSETLEDAWWIAKKCVEPVWKVERERRNVGIKPGDLKKYASTESGNRQGDLVADDLADSHKKSGQSQDLITYWKIWSRCGLTRLSEAGDPRIPEVETETKKKISQLTGDYVYLEVANGCPFPINAPTEFLQNATNEEVVKAFGWPIPFWKKDRWPVTVLDFYRRPKFAWPIAPLAPGLGELKAINILFSHLVNKVWVTMRDFIVIASSAADELKAQIEQGDDLSILKLEPIQTNINEVVSFLQHPPWQKDIFQVLEYLLDMFDRRTGLTDLLYGMQGSTQSRSATDVKIREQMTNIRPEYMASKVEEWMSQVAKSEAFATRWYVEGQDVVPLMGQTGAMLWDHFITQSDVERTIDEIDYRVEAASAMRPNRERDTSNMQAFIQTFGPILDQHANATGDTTALNNLIKRWGQTAQMDTSDLMLGERPQQPSPEQQMQAQQQQAQMEAQQQAQVEQQKLAVQQQSEQMKAQVQMALAQQKAQLDAAKAQQEMVQDQQKHDLEMQQAAQKAQLDAALEQRRVQNEAQQLEMEGVKTQMNLAAEQQKVKTQAQQSLIDLTTAKKQADLQTTTQRQQAKQQLTAQKQQAQAKQQAIKKQSAQKPKPSGGNGK